MKLSTDNINLIFVPITLLIGLGGIPLMIYLRFNSDIPRDFVLFSLIMSIITIIIIWAIIYNRLEKQEKKGEHKIYSGTQPNNQSVKN